MWDRALIGIKELTRPPGCNPQRFGGHRASDAEIFWQVVDDLDKLFWLDHVEPPGVVFVDGGVVIGRIGVGETSRSNTRPRVDPHGTSQARNFVGSAQECKFAGA